MEISEKFASSAVVRPLIQGCITHQIHYGSMKLQAAVIEVASIFHANEIWDLHRIHDARSMTRQYARRDGLVRSRYLVNRQLI